MRATGRGRSDAAWRRSRASCCASGGETVLYIAGDTIFCTEVETTLEEHLPDVTVVNAAGAHFLTGDPIVMTAEDVVSMCRALPKTRVVAVHVESLNHCFLTRRELRETLRRERLHDRIVIPEDGETLRMSGHPVDG